jgi:predicted enzyme related to lactoylglutathione lyase
MPSRFKHASPYADDEMNLPVRELDAAIPFYETVMGFRVTDRADSPPRRAILSRDSVRIGLCENGGDPAQEGCFFEVDDVEAAFDELKSRGLTNQKPDFKLERHADILWKVFFVLAPDGLCYCLGQRQ